MSAPIPGDWRCETCGFLLQMAFIDRAGNVGVNATLERHECPNGHGLLVQGTEADRIADMARTIDHLDAENARLLELINRPTVDDFARGVRLEAAHQRERWGPEHDEGKTPFDWFWLVGYLAQKAATAAVAGDYEKALHHTISTAGALANWHETLTRSRG